jgi:sigma-B regulation protein RsbU (phosphoserine phosphatase)
MAVGMEADFSYQQQSISMEPGDFLFLYTDGALDAVVRQKPFNEEELQSFIHRHRNADPTQLVSMLKENLCEGNGGTRLHDDLTLIMWKRRVNNGND